MKTLHFHIGRGGRFNNQGFKTFQGEKSMSQLINGGSNDTFISWENFDKIKSDLEKEGNDELIDLLESSKDNHDFSEFETKTGLSLGKEIIVDHNGTYIIDADAETGTLNWDNDYDTDVIINLDECEESELNLILNSSEWNKHDLIQEFFNEHTELNIDWKRFDGDYENLIIGYFNIPNFDVTDFYEMKETENE